MRFLNIKIIHSIATLNRAHGGPTVFLEALREKLATVQQEHITETGGDALPNVALWSSQERGWLGGNYRYADSVRAFAKSIGNRLPGASDEMVLHDHGLWRPINYAADRVSRQFRLPRIVTLHGMLEPWALADRGGVKKLLSWAWQRRALQTARAVQVTSRTEANSLRRHSPQATCAIVPYGVTPCIEGKNGAERLIKNFIHENGLLPEASSQTPSSEGKAIPSPNWDACNAPLRKSEITRFINLGRIHPKKNLATLVQAAAQLPRTSWNLQIAGYAEAGEEQLLQKIVLVSGLADQVQILPPKQGEEKADFFAQADVFVLPSFTENLGIVVVEALLSGIPVIATTGTPWSCLPKIGAGWWVPPTVEGIGAALQEAQAMSRDQLREMGEKGKAFAKSRFGWDRIAPRMEALYRWAAGDGVKPGFVFAPGEEITGDEFGFQEGER